MVPPRRSLMSRDTEVPFAQPASSGSRRLASFAERFRLELNQQRKQKQASLEDGIPADLPRNDRLSRPSLCDVPLALSSSAEVGIGNREIDHLAEMILGGISNPITQQSARAINVIVSNETLKNLHSSTQRTI